MKAALQPKAEPTVRLRRPATAMITAKTTAMMITTVHTDRGRSRVG